MAETVNVRSFAALGHFRAEFCTFAEEAKNALSSVEMEVRRTRDWLERQQLTYWLAQVKRCNEKLGQARTDLHRKRISQSGSDAVSDSDQKEALREAQKRLREAEEKVRTIKHWIPILEHATAEYHSVSQPLGDRLQGDVEHSLALLDRMLASLEAYVALAPPPTSRPAFVPAAAAAPTTAAKPATAGASSSSQTSTSQAEKTAPSEATQPEEPEPAEAVGDDGSVPAASASQATSSIETPG